MRTKAILILALISVGVNVYSQTTQKGLVAIQIIDTNPEHITILQTVQEKFSNLLENNGRTVTPYNEDIFNTMYTLYTMYYNDTNGDYVLSDTIPIDYLYQLWLSKENDTYIFLSRQIGKNKAENKLERSVQKDSKLVCNKDEKRRDEMRELTAYEIYQTYFSQIPVNMSDRFKYLKDVEKKIVMDANKNDKSYTALSFLPPFNQCRFNDKKTCKNILEGYGLSIITYGISTYYYNSFKSDYDNNKHVDLEETNKALKTAEDGMRICRTGQIASGILFLGTYFYGVYTSLHNRNTYQKSQNLTLVPAAYDNGAGVALVYRF